MIRLCFTILLSVFISQASAQFIVQSDNQVEKQSLHEFATIADVGLVELSLEDFLARKNEFQFSKLTGANTNVGFTKNYYWLDFAIKNETAQKQYYILETARPITDLVDLYLVDGNGKISIQKSGDNMPFDNRSVEHRKSIFEVEIEPGETLQAYLHLGSDGEVINLPLILYSNLEFLKTTYLDQLVFGFFYGILALAAITYLFFFFALREKSFLYYSLYVISIGLMQFALDGYFYQYLTPDGGWLSLRAVILFAGISTFFLGRYSQLFLNIKQHSPFFQKTYYGFFVFVGLAIFGTLFIPAFLEFSYPVANALGLILLGIIIGAIVNLRLKKVKVDGFFITGIAFLVLGFVIFILNNFSVIENSFWTENSPKFGTGLEIIFLSLSMGNRIRQLRSEKEEMQALALQKAEEMNEHKSYFLSNMSHELRTPLNAIMSMAAELSREAKDDETRRNADVIKYASIGLLSSVNDILDFSQIEKGQLNLDIIQFEPRKMLKVIEKNAQQQAKEKGLEFIFTIDDELPNELLGDPLRLAQIINNVLNNAIKFTLEGFVHFDLQVRKNAGGTKATVEINISDSGVGIPESKIETIFNLFTQERIDDKRKFGGVGLGLSIVKSLVDLHGGKIEITSKQHVGTQCKILLDYEIPLHETKLETTTYLQKDFKELGNISILVVEDNPINQMVIKIIAKNWEDCEVQFANNGEEGLTLLAQNDFDIVLMDLQMPVMDGYETTLSIRNGSVGKHKIHIPIIAVTADVMETTRQRVFTIGMDDYMSKPVDAEELRSKIMKLLIERKQRSAS
ncbi:7TM diverse intracellular signaling domain-containing protein [Peijinzhouia sedimentorum]